MVLQFEFDQPRLVVAAVKDGKVAPGTFVLVVLILNLDRYALGLGLFIAAADHA